MMYSHQWWQNMPGPQRFVHQFVEALENKGTAWVSGPLSWHDSFLEIVKDELENHDSNINIEYINAADLPVKYRIEDIVFQYDAAARDHYLPAVGLAKHLQSGSFLKSTILWVYNLDAKDGGWMELSKNLARLGAGIKVVCDGAAVTGASKNVSVFYQNRFLSEFDYLLFAMALIQGRRWNSEVKLYVCRLANELACQNAEAISELIEHGEELLLSPAQCAAHYSSCMDELEIANGIRNAQMMSFFPRIEQRRAEIVAAISERVNRLLPFTDEYGTEFCTPDEIELRHLVHFEGRGVLYLSAEEHKEVHFLWNVRNDLAHRIRLDGNTAFSLLSD